MPLLSIKLKNKNKSNNIHLYMSTRIKVMEKQTIELANKYGILKLDLENKFTVKKEESK